jgi:hypothetical protein
MGSVPSASKQERAAPKKKNQQNKPNFSSNAIEPNKLSESQISPKQREGKPVEVKPWQRNETEPRA